MPGSIRPVPCDACDGISFASLYQKRSSRDELFQLVRCTKCGLVQVNPQPDVDAVRPYYEESYFAKRTDRGYDNYFSAALKKQILHVYELNLRDLRFDLYEERVKRTGVVRPRTLDVGCAAGYFVEHMADRGWQSQGVEISPAAAKFGIETLKLDILIGDFLSCKELLPGSFQAVTLWASIEHMPSPKSVLKRCHELLAPGGRMLLSTCRYGILARVAGASWRYMNVPEHLYFFSLRGLASLAHNVGFAVEKFVTYGSGMTTRKDAGPFYKAAKQVFDPVVKMLGQGDMMGFHLRKVSH